MISRRSLTKSSLAGLAAIGVSRDLSTFAQTPVIDSPELSYQGLLAFNNLPDLPTAPEGETAVVMQKSDTLGATAAVIHNGANADVFLNSVKATVTYDDGASVDSVPEDSLHAPIKLAPGDYGIAVVELPPPWGDTPDVVFSLELVSESEVDPTLVNMPVTQVQLVEVDGFHSVNLEVHNRSENYLAENSGFVAVFFDEEGQIIEFLNSQFAAETDPGERRWISHTSTGFRESDSFMAGFMGRVLE